MIRRLRNILLLVALLALASSVLLYYQWQQPLPALTAQPALSATMALGGEPPELPWPTTGAAAVGVAGLGSLAASADQRPRPIASLAKVMTAYLVLHDHPLRPGDRGPTVTVTADDVATYQQELADDQSVVPVAEGEQLTEYQLLQALLVPAGNNIAEILAAWDAGAVAAFVAQMNARAADLGMTATHFADPSGVAPQTVSTAPDLILLTQAAMADPTFAAIVTQEQVTLPLVGTVFNTNAALGQQGMVGVKTGSTPEAGACFVFAADQQVNGEDVLVLGAVLDQPQLSDAFAVSEALAAAVPAGFASATVLAAAQIVGSYDAPWGAHVDVAPPHEVDVVGWPGSPVDLAVDLEPMAAPLAAGARVGSVTVRTGNQAQTVELLTTGPLDLPDQRWRLLRSLQRSD